MQVIIKLLLHKIIMLLSSNKKAGEASLKWQQKKWIREQTLVFSFIYIYFIIDLGGCLCTKILEL